MNVLLVYGGRSCEHDISVITACLAKGYFGGNLFCAYLDKSNNCFLLPVGYTPKQHVGTPKGKPLTFVLGKSQVEVQLSKHRAKRININVAVNCCHGNCGEDGTVAALCKMANIPLVGSDVVPSAIAMDKWATKCLLRGGKFPVLPGKLLQSNCLANLPNAAKGLAYPVIVKPCTLGSSIGITLCRNSTQLAAALKKAFCYDSRVLCEHALQNFVELNCAAMAVDGKVVASAVETPHTTNDILTFNDKYLGGCWTNKPKAELPAQLVCQVQQLTAQIYGYFNFGGVVRVDYLLDNASGKLYVNEINSVPGSLAYGLWSVVYTPQQFGSLLLDAALHCYKRQNQLICTLDTGVLEVGGTKGKK